MGKKSIGYGVSQYAMINAGSQQMAIIPMMEGPLSICSARGLGKNQFLQSMQFLFFSHLEHMDFGCYDQCTSRDFYFPGDNSFLVMEIVLPDGIYLLGAHGKSSVSGQDYGHFVCKKNLIADDFMDSGYALPYQKVFELWTEKGYSLLFLSREELRQILYGEFARVKNGLIDLTLIPLVDAGICNYEHFTTIYRCLLSFTVLTGKDIKKIISARGETHNIQSSGLRDENQCIAKYSVVNASRSIKELWNGFVAIKKEIAQMNRLLKNFNQFTGKLSIRISKSSTLYNIETLNTFLENYEKYSMDMFGSCQAETACEELKFAIDDLTREVFQGGDRSLATTDLFDIEFVQIDPQGMEILSEQIGHSGSMGTTAKYLICMHLIRYLSDKKAFHIAHLPFQVDAENTDNQIQMLIARYAKELGFISVFSSEQPSITARYLINLDECLLNSQRIQVTTENWQKLNDDGDESNEDQLELLV